MATMKSVTARGTRLEQLKTLARVLAVNIDSCKDAKTLPQLAKQYRETIREIEENQSSKSFPHKSISDGAFHKLHPDQ